MARCKLLPLALLLVLHSAFGDVGSNIFLTGEYKNSIDSHPITSEFENSIRSNIFLDHAVFSRQAQPFTAPTYLPPKEYIKCGGAQQCVKKNVCVGGYFTNNPSGYIQNCEPETDVCCTYRAPPTTTTTTQRPYVPCGGDSDCVAPNQCSRGTINVSIYNKKSSANRCYAPEVCCRLPATALTPDGYVLTVPHIPFPQPPTPPKYNPPAISPPKYNPPAPAPPAYIPPARPTPPSYQPPAPPAPPAYRPPAPPAPPAYRPPAPPAPPAYRPPAPPAPPAYIPPAPPAPPAYRPPAPPAPPVYQPPKPQPPQYIPPAAPSYPTPRPQPPRYNPPAPPAPPAYRPPAPPSPPAYIPPAPPAPPQPRPQPPRQPPPRPQPTPALRPTKEYLPPQQPLNPIGSPSDQVPVRGEGILSEPIFPTRKPPIFGDNNLSPFTPQKCSAALICTDINFCTTLGIISDSPSNLTPQQAAFRVPLTDCVIEGSGAPGKCCRDSNYVDPWPVNPTGQCASRNRNTKPRGVTEEDTSFAEIPWQAMVLKESSKSLLCGGAIIGYAMVLTTASCLAGEPTKDVLVKAGEWQLGNDDEPLPFQLVRATEIEVHPGYDPASGQNNLAIILLEKNLQTAVHVSPICISDKDPSPSEHCVVTGWGKDALKIHQQGALMHQTPVETVSRSECGASSTQVCARTKFDACNVDYGSALACGSGSSYKLKGTFTGEDQCGNSIASFTKPDIKWINTAFNRNNRALALG